MKESNLPLFPLIRSKKQPHWVLFYFFCTSHFGFSFFRIESGNETFVNDSKETVCYKNLFRNGESRVIEKRNVSEFTTLSKGILSCYF
ncbi:hypothetical protein [Leptospira santarosai]|uniref:hypothetical protein n=1 Tax=Leptospira santarosai TaxID=28183 RepID=UPI0006283FA7